MRRFAWDKPKGQLNETWLHITQGRHLMAEKDVETLALFIKYCEEEAVRLRSPAIVINGLRLVREELAKSVSTPLTMITVDDRCTRH
jgi:hypothetical protein